jgi:hypothetical protein
MKQATKLLGVAAVAVSISCLASTTLARGGHGGSWGGFHHGYRGWGGWYPWGLSFSYVYSSPPYYYYDYYPPPVYYYPPPAVYSSPPAVVYNSPPPAPEVESSQRSAVDRPLSPTAVDRDSPPPAPRAQRPPQIQRSDQGQSIGVADVKALVKAGLSEEVILSQIRNSHAVYHLTTAEIIELKESGVSEKAIDFMINTASGLSEPAVR